MSSGVFEDHLKSAGEVGYVEVVIQSVIRISGMPGARIGEMLLLESGQTGQVTALRPDLVEALVLSRQPARVGIRVARTGKRISIKVGKSMLGKVVDVLGIPFDGRSIDGEDVRDMNVDALPAGIMARKKISRPLETGVSVVDLMVPLGKGQRELIAGDRKTGKSQLLMETMIAQARLGSICVYAAIGKKKTEIMRVGEFLQQQGVGDRVIVVAASSQDSAGEINLCPYSAMAVAEYFRDQGQDVVLVMDDMTTHAKFYRELSLLSRKFPGRDSYPGDIFHVHSRLLERGGNFVVGDKEAAITCLPVVETVQGDITGYVQTNMMSMTDGHIYFDSELFFKGRRPAVNPFVSVTRVGRQTQTKLRRDAGRVLYDLLSNFERTQSFLKFGAELGENSRQILAMGDKVLKFFDQPLFSHVPINLQLVLLALVLSGMWDGSNITRFTGVYTSDASFSRVIDEIVMGNDSMPRLMEECRRQSGLLTKLNTPA